jgi:hypothetical protein
MNCAGASVRSWWFSVIDIVDESRCILKVNISADLFFRRFCFMLIISLIFIIFFFFSFCQFVCM